jgi:hypothetical protein
MRLYAANDQRSSEDNLKTVIGIIVGMPVFLIEQVLHRASRQTPA